MHELFCSQAQGGDQDFLALLFRTCARLDPHQANVAKLSNRLGWHIGKGHKNILSVHAIGEKIHKIIKSDFTFYLFIDFFIWCNWCCITNTFHLQYTYSFKVTSNFIQKIKFY